MKTSLFKTMMLTCALFLLLSAQVFAAKAYDIELDANGNVKVTADEAGGGGIASVQISLIVTPQVPEAEVGFRFAEGLPAKIQEYRYNAQTQTLVLYLAGTKPLFAPEAREISVGTVTVTRNGRPAAATIRAAENGLKYANGTAASTIAVSGEVSLQGEADSSGSETESSSEEQSAPDSLEGQNSSAAESSNGWQNGDSSGSANSNIETGDSAPQNGESGTITGNQGSSAPETSSKNPGQQTNGASSESPATGDRSPILLLMLSLAVSGTALAALIARKARKSHC